MYVCVYVCIYVNILHFEYAIQNPKKYHISDKLCIKVYNKKFTPSDNIS